MGPNPGIQSPAFDRANTDGNVWLRVDGGTMTNGGTGCDHAITYLVQDAVMVPSRKTLVIAAGQVVKFREFGNFGITVNGTLAANGTGAAPIYFTTTRDDSVGGDVYNDGAASAYAGQWDALRFNSSSTANVLDHVEVRYGGENGVAAVFADGGPLKLTDSIVRDSSAHAVLARSSANVEVTNDLIVRNNATSIRADSLAEVTAVNSTIDGNSRGAAVNGISTVLVLTNNLITNNSRAGVTDTNRGSATLSCNDVFNPTRFRRKLQRAGDGNGPKWQ